MSEEIKGQAAPEAVVDESSEYESSESSEGLEQAQDGQEEASVEEQVAKANPDLSKKEIQKEAARIKKLRLKVDGREIEEEVNLDDEEYLVKELQKAKAFNKRAQEYSQLQKEIQEFFDQLKKNPRKILQDPNIGIDMKELARQVIEDEIENSKKSPEQIEKEKLEAELASLKEKYEKEQKELKERENQRLMEMEFERYDAMIDGALKESDLPKSPYVVKKLAEYMHLGVSNGINVSAKDVLPLVREEILSDIKSMFGAMPDEVLESVLGKDTIGRLRKRSIAKAKTVSASQLQKQPAKELEPKKVEKKSFKEFFKV